MARPPGGGVLAPLRLPGGAVGRRIVQIAVLTDIARFRPDDPDILVLASLACPVCLGGDDVSWEAELAGYDPSIGCHCASCQTRWRVYVAPEQVLRLSLVLVAA